MLGFSIQVSQLIVGGRRLFPKGLRITVQAGQPTLLTGPNGCGKSVLFNYLSGWSESINDLKFEGEFSFNNRGFLLPDGLNEYQNFARDKIVLLSHRLNEERLGVTFGEEMDLILSRFEEPIPSPISEAFAILCAQIEFQKEIDNLAAGHRQLLAFLDVIGRARTCQAILLDEPTSFLGDKLIPILTSLVDWLTKQNPSCAVLIATHDERLLQVYQPVINISEQLPGFRSAVDLAPVERIYARNKPLSSSIQLDGFSRDQARRYPRFATTINCGESLLVTGPSGAGKTTFLKACGGLKRIKGTLVYHNGEGQKISKKDLYPHYFGFLFQTPFDHEFRSNIASILLPSDGLSEQDSKDYSHFIANFLDAFSISEEQNPRTLSSGQLRIVWIISQLTWGGRWLLDEPDAALDKDSLILLLALLSLHLRHGGTLMIVTHNPGIFAVLNIPNLQLVNSSSI